MSTEPEPEISGLALLEQPSTPALQRYLEDHYANIAFQAYLWRMVVTVDYGHGDVSRFPAPGDSAPPESAAGQMEVHSRFLGQMTFSRAVNSFETYLADLLTMIFEANPNALKSNSQVSREFCIEHYAAGDLMSALAEQTVHELAYQSLSALADFFAKKLKLPLFAKAEELATAALCVDVRNIITHNRGIVNKIFVQRHPDHADRLGQPFDLHDIDARMMTGGLLYRARQIDIRAAKKFGLVTTARQAASEDENLEAETTEKPA